MQTTITNTSGVKNSNSLLNENICLQTSLSADSECINPLIDETHRLVIYVHDDRLLRRVEQVAAICTKPAHVVNGIYLLLRERGIDKGILLSDDFIRTLLPYLKFKVGVKTLHNLFLRRESTL